MTEVKKGGASAPLIPPKRLMSLDSLADLLRQLEPEWTQPDHETLREIIIHIELAGSAKKRRSVRKKTEVERAIDALRRAAQAQVNRFERGEAIVASLDLADPEGAPSAESRSADPRQHLERLLEWLGDRDASEIAIFDLGQPASTPPEPSWYSKCRRIAPLLANAWHPVGATHPVSPTSSIVQVLDGLLRATGERHAPSGYTPQALVNFLGRERYLLGRP